MVQIYSWLHSTFKELSNDTSHAQIRVKTNKLCPRQVGQRKASRQKNYVVTKFSVATEKLCRNSKFFVAT